MSRKKETAPPAKTPPSTGRPEVRGFGPREVATTFAVLPRFEDSALMPETPGRLLGALRGRIEELSIEQAGSGIRHEEGRYVVLPRTLRSAWMARVNHPVLGELRFLVGQTRSTWVLLYDQPPERIYEDPRFMNVELKKRDVAITPAGKRMYVSRIRRADLDTINTIAAKDAGGGVPRNTLAPVEGAFSYEETITRLLQCDLVRCTDPGFDLVTFLTSVRFMTPTQGASGNYYYLEAGDPDDPLTCELHVGRDPGLPEDTYAHQAVLSLENERSFLYIDLRY